MGVASRENRSTFYSSILVSTEKGEKKGEGESCQPRPPSVGKKSRRTKREHRRLSTKGEKKKKKLKRATVSLGAESVPRSEVCTAMRKGKTRNEGGGHCVFQRRQSTTQARAKKERI